MKIYLEMTRQVGKNVVPSIIGTGLASIMICWVLKGTVPDSLVLLWVSIQIILLAVRFHFANAFNHCNTENERWVKAVKRFPWAMFFVGLGWGMASILIALYGTL